MFSWLDNNFSISVEQSLEKKRVTIYISHGETTVMCIGKVGEWCDSNGFVPLVVDYFERSYAINRIPGGFIKRESRQKENEILTSRLIDRSIRPTIASSFKFDICLSCFVLSYSRECPPEPLCITACSAALQALGVPSTMVVGMKMFHTDKWSTSYSRARSTATIAGNHYGISSFEFSGGDLSLQEVADVAVFAGPKMNYLLEKVAEVVSELPKPQYALPSFEKASGVIDANALLKNYRRADFGSVSTQKAQFLSTWNNKKLGEEQWSTAVREVLRQSLFWTDKRLDGRQFDDAREMEFEAPFLKKLHGSSVFSKGGTKCFCAVTISNNNDYQLYEALEGNENRKFIVNYNFLGGDERINGSSNRREIGHGNLARNALKNLVSDDRFIRVISEVISSDGSSSMGTVCAAWLALKTAGIKVSQTIAGISVGLIYKDFITKFMVDLTEIEDFLSDMDLKVAGTHNGFTVIQMDLKVQYLPWDVFKKALAYSFSQLKSVIHKIEKDVTDPNEQPVPERRVEQHRRSDREGQNEFRQGGHEGDRNRSQDREKIERSNLQAELSQKEIAQKIIDKVTAERPVKEDRPEANADQNKAKYIKDNQKKDNNKSDFVNNVANNSVGKNEIKPAEKLRTNSGSEQKKKEENAKKPNLDKGKPKDQGKKAFSLKLPADKLAAVEPMLEKLKSETENNIYIRNDSLNIYGKDLEATVSKVLSAVYESEKELNYAKIEKISDKVINFKLLGGKKASIAKNERTADLKEGEGIVVYKGRKWTFFNILS